MPSEARVIENDAIVVLCLKDTEDSMSSHEFRIRASVRGFQLTKSACHNMLHRSMGRTMLDRDSKWRLTAMGVAYREEVLIIVSNVLKWEISRSA